MTIASGAAWESRSSVTPKGGKIRSRCSDSSSRPMLTHESVTTTSTPATASTGSAVSSIEPPVPCAISRALATTWASGVNPSGAPTTTCMPAEAPARTHELPMLQAPSPTKATRIPANLPLCSRTVCRSARSWQGWNSSVSALSTGTPAYAAMVTTSPWWAVRHTTAAAWRPRIRATSSTPSRDPIAARPPSTVIGLPPSSAMPAANDTWVRRVGRSKTRATVRGPASGLWSNGSAFIRSARSRTSSSSAGDRSSSRRKWRVMRGPRDVVRRSEAGEKNVVGCSCGGLLCCGAGGVEDGGQGRVEGVEVGGRDHQRRHEPQPRRAGGVEDEAGLAPGRHGPRGVGAVELGAAHETRARHLDDAGLLAQERLELDAPGDGGVQQAVGLDRLEDGEGGSGRDRVAAEGGAVVARLEQRCRVAAGDRRADRDAAAEALGERDDVGLHAVEQLVGEPRAGAGHAGLHLVEPQQRTVAVGDPLGGGEVVRGRHDDAGLSLHRFEDDRGDRVVDRGLERGHVVVRDEGDVAREGLERLAVGSLGREGQRAHGATVERALGRDEPGAAGPAGELERGLVGLGAGVAEEDARVVGPAEEADEALRQGDLRLGGEEVGDVAEGAELGGDGLDEGGVGVAEGVDGDAAEQVDVLLAVGVPHVRTLPAGERQHRRAEGVHDRAGVALLDVAHDSSLG